MKIPQRERLPIPSRQGERRFTGSICSTRSEHSRRRTTECQANSTHKMGEVVFLVERALQHHAASHLQTFHVEGPQKMTDHLLLIDFATETHIHTYSYMDLHYMQLLPPSTWGSVQKTKPLRLRCSKPSFNTTAEPRWGRSPPPAVPGAGGISRSTAEQCERTNSTRRYLTFTRRDASRFWRSSSRPFP